MPTMPISNCLFSPTSDTSTKCELAKQNPLGFSVWSVLNRKASALKPATAHIPTVARNLIKIVNN